MRTKASSSSTRRLVVVLVVACSALSGCFALFSLDGYGPPPDDVDAAPAQALDARASDVVVEGAPGPVGDAAPAGRTVFVTGATFTGNLGMRDGGDMTCQAVAADAGLPGTYRVWLSDVAGDAVAHLARDAGPLRLPSGVIVAANVDELVDAGPRVPIALDERGRMVGGGGCDDGGLVAWTDTSSNGSVEGSLDCSRWTSANVFIQGVVGLVGQLGSGWTVACTRTCDSQAALYCIQQ